MSEPNDAQDAGYFRYLEALVRQWGQVTLTYDPDIPASWGIDVAKVACEQAGEPHGVARQASLREAFDEAAELNEAAEADCDHAPNNHRGGTGT